MSSISSLICVSRVLFKAKRNRISLNGRVPTECFYFLRYKGWFALGEDCRLLAPRIKLNRETKNFSRYACNLRLMETSLNCFLRAQNKIMKNVYFSGKRCSHVLGKHSRPILLRLNSKIFSKLTANWAANWTVCCYDRVGCSAMHGGSDREFKPHEGHVAAILEKALYCACFFVVVVMITLVFLGMKVRHEREFRFMPST